MNRPVEVKVCKGFQVCGRGHLVIGKSTKLVKQALVEVVQSSFLVLTQTITLQFLVTCIAALPVTLHHLSAYKT